MTTLPVTIQERIALPETSAAPAPASGVTVKDVVSTIKRRMIMIIFVWILLSAIGAMVWYFLWKYYPIYRATATILCESPQPMGPFDYAPPDFSEDTVLRFITNQAYMVKSEDVLRRALARSEVKDTTWYKEIKQKSKEHLLELNADLSSSPIRNTNYVTVSMGCHDIEDPHKIVSTVVECYLDWTQEMARREFRDRLEESKRDEENYIKQINEKRNQLRTLAAELGPGVVSEVNVVSEQLIYYGSEVARARAQLEQLRALKEAYDTPGGPPISAEEQSMVELDPQISLLNQSITGLDQELQVMLNRYGPKYKDVMMLQARLNQTSEKLERLKAIKLEEVRANQKEQIDLLFRSSTDEVLQLQEQYEALAGRQADQDRKLAEYKYLDDELELLKDNYLKIADFTRDLTRIIGSKTTLDIRQVQAATKPLEKSSPRPEIFLPAAVLGSLLIALGLALLLDFIDTSVRTPSDISRHVGVPILGTIPDVDDEEVQIERVETAVRDYPHSMVVEAFRAIRTNLMFSGPMERQKSILVTSPRPEDGKTTVASNLALAISQSGRRVLLVDANFRRPSLQKIYPSSSKGGLSNVLIGQGRLEDLVVRTDMPNLDVLFSGPLPPNPGELLGSSYLRDLIDKAGQHYDQIIFDCSPVLLVSDAIVLSSLVDGAILVLRASANSRGVAQRARDQLERVNGHIFGAVLNVAQARRGGYFREQLRSFYEYHELESQEVQSPPALPKDTAANGHANGEEKV